MRFLKTILLIMALGSMWPCIAQAITIEQRLPEAEEVRAIALFQQIRCMVCTGESVYDSRAELAQEMRVLVREKITAGESDAEILHYLTARYGDAILMAPPVSPATGLLWLLPWVMGAVGGAVIILYILRRKHD